MTFKILPVLVAILACALWPQGVVLCMGTEGHVEVELEGSGCCPSETDENCIDCADFASPDQRSAPPIVVLAPPSTCGLNLLPKRSSVTDHTVTSTPLLPLRDSVLEGVILLV